jgi:D-alanyl-D-alanine carboxypeptidase (penicillin-binding protein 5/6)
VPTTRRQLYRRRRVAVFTALALVLAAGFYLPMTLLAPLQAADPVLSKQAVLPGAAAQLAFPAYGASAIGAVGFDGVLAQAGSTGPLPMASITKIVTTLVVLQAKPLAVGQEGPSVKMTAKDASYYGHYLSLDGTVAPVKAGWTFTQHELLQLTLVHSANNYAASLAVWAFGSMDAYLAAARSWVTAHQLGSMTITDPTGIEPTDVASAADLVALGKLALADPVISAIVDTKAITIHDAGTFKNTNSLLGVKGIDGIKTGTLNDAGSNLLFAADHRVGGSSVTIVGVVLGGVTHKALDSDIRTLIAGVESGFHELKLVTKGDRYARYTMDWGQTTTAIARTSASVVTWSDAVVTVTTTAAPVTTGSAGKTVGTVTFTVAGRTIQVPLKLSKTVRDPGPGWRLGHPGLIVGSP